MEGLFHILKINYAQKNVHFWKQKLLLLLLVKKSIQVPWTYQNVLFTQKSLSGIKCSDKNLHKPGGSKHASNFLRSIRS